MATKDSGKASLWVWIPLGLALGLFVAFILFLDGKKQINQKEEGAVDIEKTQPKTERAKPVFDFYTVLPDRKVIIDPEEMENGSTKKPQTNSTTQSTQQKEQKTKPKQAYQSYILQVGSFNNYADADELKAQLAFLGLEGKLTDAKIKDVTWYRVHLGPFESSSGLSNTKNLLIENNIKYLQKKSG